MPVMLAASRKNRKDENRESLLRQRPRLERHLRKQKMLEAFRQRRFNGGALTLRPRPPQPGNGRARHGTELGLGRCHAIALQAGRLGSTGLHIAEAFEWALRFGGILTTPKRGSPCTGSAKLPTLSTCQHMLLHMPLHTAVFEALLSPWLATSCSVLGCCHASRAIIDLPVAVSTMWTHSMFVDFAEHLGDKAWRTSPEQSPRHTSWLCSWG